MTGGILRRDLATPWGTYGAGFHCDVLESTAISALLALPGGKHVSVPRASVLVGADAVPLRVRCIDCGADALRGNGNRCVDCRALVDDTNRILRRAARRTKVS